MRMLLGLVLLTACVTARDEERRPSFPGAEANAVGSSVAVIITWTPGSTDSIVFTASQATVPVANIRRVKPFSGVDTLILGPRPAPGVTDSWDVGAEYWWTDRGTSVAGSAALGTVSYTEPLPAGTAPTFGPLGPADTTLAGTNPPPGPTLAGLTVWTGGPDSANQSSFFLTARNSYQFCALALMTDGTWRSPDSTRADSASATSPADTVWTTVVPPECVAEVQRRNANPLTPAGVWMWLQRRRPTPVTVALR